MAKRWNGDAERGRVVKGIKARKEEGSDGQERDQGCSTGGPQATHGPQVVNM